MSWRNRDKEVEIVKIKKNIYVKNFDNCILINLVFFVFICILFYEFNNFILIGIYSY